jgi:probable phosphoglycerate mutase
VPLIYLIRHAENKANVDRVMAFKAVDYPLTERGTRQAEALGRWFLDRALGCIYTSPLRRARETAEQIGGATGAAIVAREELRELNVGHLDGKGDDQSWALHDAIVARWITGDWTARFPGGESYREAFDRLEGLLLEIVGLHREDDVAVIGHGGLFSTVLPRVCPVPGDDGLQPLRLGNTAVTVLRHESGVFSCEQWGGLDHLPATLRTGGGIVSPPR